MEKIKSVWNATAKSIEEFAMGFDVTIDGSKVIIIGMVLIVIVSTVVALTSTYL